MTRVTGEEASIVEVINKVYPNEEQIKGFLAPGAEGPICMVNLMTFKAKADYEDGRETNLSGREAYALYAQGVKTLLEGIGGSIGFGRRGAPDAWRSRGVVGRRRPGGLAFSPSDV